MNYSISESFWLIYQNEINSAFLYLSTQIIIVLKLLIQLSVLKFRLNTFIL